MEKLIKSESHGRCRGENKKKKEKREIYFQKEKKRVYCYCIIWLDISLLLFFLRKWYMNGLVLPLIPPLSLMTREGEATWYSLLNSVY